MRVSGGEGGRVILEAFKPGTAPPDSYSVIGYNPEAGSSNPGLGPGPDQGSAPPGYIPPQPNRQIRSGTGGLY
jgi:penicillin-binding protein 1A